MMKLKMWVAAAALLVSGLAPAAVVTVNAGAYAITYDNATPGFGALSNLTANGNVLSFEWSVQSAVKVQSFAAGTVTATFAIPSFTITAENGWTLSNLSSTLGNITYFEAGPAASTSMAAGATVAINGGTPLTVPPMLLKRVASDDNTGWFVDAAAAPPGNFTTLSITNAALVLTASAGPGSFAAITGQPQNKLSFSLVANPVPEPETYALMLAGLGVVGLMARRRRAG
jgi:hypothetical protein